MEIDPEGRVEHRRFNAARSPIFDKLFLIVALRSLRRELSNKNTG